MMHTSLCLVHLAKPLVTSLHLCLKEKNYSRYLKYDTMTTIITSMQDDIRDKRTSRKERMTMTSLLCDLLLLLDFILTK